jgi:hypothetical protein
MSSEDFEREERAFAEALRKDAPVEAFRPLDPAAIRAAAGPVADAGRRRWITGLAAAAALVVVAGAAAVILPRVVGGTATASATYAGVPEPAGGAAPMDAQDRANAPESAPAPASVPGAKATAWLDLPDAPLSARRGAAGAWLDGRFYLFGGSPSGSCPPTQVCPLPSPRRDGASADPVSGTWRKLADAPETVSGPVAVDHRFYFTATSGDSRVLSYSPVLDSWATLPATKGLGQLVAAGDLLVSVGASDVDGAALDQAYDPGTNRWTTLPKDPLPAAAERSAVWAEGKLVLITTSLGRAAGPAGTGYRVAELDLATRVWRTLPVTGFTGGSAVVVASKVVWVDAATRDSSPDVAVVSPGSGQVQRLPYAGLGDGLANVGGVVTGTRVGAAGHLVDISTGTWLSLEAPPSGNAVGQTVVGGPGGLLVFGGLTENDADSSAYFLPLA